MKQIIFMLITLSISMSTVAQSLTERVFPMSEEEIEYKGSIRSNLPVQELFWLIQDWAIDEYTTPNSNLKMVEERKLIFITASLDEDFTQFKKSPEIRYSLRIECDSLGIRYKITNLHFNYKPNRREEFSFPFEEYEYRLFGEIDPYSSRRLEDRVLSFFVDINHNFTQLIGEIRESTVLR